MEYTQTNNTCSNHRRMYNRITTTRDARAPTTTDVRVTTTTHVCVATTTYVHATTTANVRINRQPIATNTHTHV